MDEVDNSPKRIAHLLIAPAASEGRSWASGGTVTLRVFEEPRHLLHPPQSFRRGAAEVFRDQRPVDAGVNELEDAFIPGAVVDGRIAG